MSRPIDFSVYALNRLQLPELTREILVGPVFNLLKGTCQSCVELQYHMEECFRALTDQLDWTNPVGCDRPVDVTKNFSLGTTTSTVLQSRDQQAIQACSLIQIENSKCAKCLEGDFLDLHLNDIEDMLLLLNQNKLWNLDGDVIIDLGVALRMFTHGIILKSRVEDVQLGVESYQRKFNLSPPQRSYPCIEAKEPYAKNYDPPGFIYVDKEEKKRLMQIDELHKFCDWTLQSVHTTLLNRLKNLSLGYNRHSNMPLRI
ncbi:hypothetical protein Tco_1103429 [Tanacetum coccineum]